MNHQLLCSSFNTFLSSISEGDLTKFLRSFSEDFVNRVYKHNITEHGIIKAEFVPKGGHKDLRPIHLACDRGNIEIVKNLMAYECHLEVHSKIGNRAIHVAASRGYWQIVGLLIQQGCTIDAINGRGQTALHLAAKYENCKVAKVLLLAGANVDLMDCTSCTAEQVAKIYDNEVTGTVLKEWKRFMEIPKNTQQQRCKRLLKESTFKKFYVNNDVCVDAVMKYIMKCDPCKSLDALINELRFYHYIKRHQEEDWLMHADIEAVSKIFRTEAALEYCLDDDDNCPYFVSNLIQLIVDMNQMEAVLQKIHSIVKKLRNKNITGLVSQRITFVNIKKKALWNRLHLAVSDGRCDLIEYLLIKNLVDINAKDKMGNTPLFLACIHGHVECTRLLLSYGANINTTNKYGQTLMHIALENGMQELIKPLIQSFKTLDNRDCLGHSAIDIAMKYEFEEILEVLAPNMKSLDTIIENVSSLMNMSHGGPQVGTVTENENIASLCLKVKGFIYKSIISNMSQFGLGILDEYGSSLLHLAAWHLSYDTCEGLVERGMDINLKNFQGSTALHEVISSFIFDNSQNEQSLLMTIEVLIEAGADINLENLDHQTPLQIALQIMNEKIITRMTKKASLVLLSSADLRGMISEDQYSLMVALISKMDKDCASSHLTPDFLDSCIGSLSEADLKIIISLTSATSRDIILDRILSSTLISAINVAIVQCIVQMKASDTNHNDKMNAPDPGSITKYSPPFLRATNEYGQSPLHIAANSGYIDFLEMTMYQGHLCNYGDKMGDTVLGLLLRRGGSSRDKDYLTRVETIAKKMIQKGVGNHDSRKDIDQCRDKTLRKRLLMYARSCQLKLNDDVVAQITGEEVGRDGTH